MSTTAPQRTASGTLRGWPWFIALSLLLHLLLLLLLTRLTPALPSAVTTASAPLAVTIERQRAAQPATAPAAPTEPRAAAPRAGRPAQPPAVVAPAPAPSLPRPAPPVLPEEFDEFDGGSGQRLLDQFPDADGPAKTPRDEPQHDEETRRQIETLIRSRFADHFVYPPLARRHNWQGEVVLAFRVATDGTIAAIEVVRSSGHALLDQAALDSLRAIGRIEFVPDLRLRHEIELHMPVIYQLAQR